MHGGGGLLKRMAEGEHAQRRRRDAAVRIAHLVGPRVLLQVILTAESLAANGAGVWPHAGVDPLVPRQLLVPGERLPAGLDVALERSLACNNREKSTNIRNISISRLFLFFFFPNVSDRAVTTKKKMRESKSRDAALQLRKELRNTRRIGMSMCLRNKKS